jgi:2-dehydropantoate 2-reductase
MKNEAGPAPWPKIAVMGSGAVGCFYGGMLARAGAPVTLIARPQHVDAIANRGLRFESLAFDEHVALDATSDLGAARDAQWVLFSVKSGDTEEAARQLAPKLDAKATVIGLQNGVDNIERMRKHLPVRVLPAVVYVAVAMAGPGHVRHTGRGDLIVGNWAGRRDFSPRELDTISATFERAGVPCRVSDNVEGELWLKLLMNCAYNAISALGRSQYKRMAASGEVQDVMRAVVGEVLAVAEAAGVRMPAGDLVEATLKLASSMPEATSSTAQDLARGKPSEVDHLNGFVFRKGRELGVPAPANQTLHALVKLLENAPAPRPAGA